MDLEATNFSAYIMFKQYFANSGVQNLFPFSIGLQLLYAWISR